MKFWPRAHQVRLPSVDTSSGSRMLKSKKAGGGHWPSAAWGEPELAMRDRSRWGS